MQKALALTAIVAVAHAIENCPLMPAQGATTAKTTNASHGVTTAAHGLTTAAATTYAPATHAVTHAVTTAATHGAIKKTPLV